MLPDNIILTEKMEEAFSIFFSDKKYSKIGILVDENTHNYCYPIIQKFIPDPILISIKSGERNKNLDTCSQIWQRLTDQSFDRKSLLVNLGGGVITDMGGFCAATYKRSIPFVNIPTTLLSQVDASIGGKLGINFHAFKNHIGIFEEPTMVLIDPVFIETQPIREIKSGFAEVIKHGLIADKLYWKEVSSKAFEQQDWKSLILRSLEIKHKVVTSDLKEKGLRKILNFGHTIGHAVESFYLHSRNKLLHGESVAIGMIAEGYLSYKLCGFKKADLDHLIGYMRTTYSSFEISQKDIPAISKLCLHDKKNVGEIINCTLLRDIGKAAYDIPITMTHVHDALMFYSQVIS